MDDERPEDDKVINLAEFVKRRRSGWRRDGGPYGPKADGNEIPPPPPDRSLPPPPSLRMPKGKGNLARAFETLAPVTEIKKIPAVRRAVLLLPLWVTPNLVTVFRTFLAIPMVYWIRNGDYGWGLGIFLFAAFLDFLDGAIAEARNMKTVTGAVLDATCDKVVNVAAFAAFIEKIPDVPRLWAYEILLCTIVFALALTVVRFVKLFIGKDAPSDVAANNAGKYKQVFETAGISACLLGYAIASPIFIPVGLTLLSIAVLLASLSLFGQIR